MALLLHDKKVIFFTPGKCSSTTVSKILTEQAGAQLFIGPQGDWRKIANLDYLDSCGKHTMECPYVAKHWKKYVFYRNPFDRFISLWKHYCKHTTNDVRFETFVEMMEKEKTNPNLWFYNWKMDEIIRSCSKDTGIIQHNDLGMVNMILASDYEFPIMNATIHDNWWTYYTPELYRRVHELA